MATANKIPNEQRSIDVRDTCRTGHADADHPLKQINDSLPHKLTLKMWEREEGILSRRIEQKEARRMSIQNEIYQLLGLDLVFQGLLLSGLFQAAEQPDTCRHWWSPFTLTVIAFLATLGAVLHKFDEQSEIEGLLEEEKKDWKALFKNIYNMGSMGTHFPLSEPPPARKAQLKLGFFASCWKYWWSYRGAITLTLIAFCVITSVSCKRLLCS